tara:strand:+ start:10040 stop:10564 length:525 start_codon:yes stop_codon:yes gene_type:complete
MSFDNYDSKIEESIINLRSLSIENIYTIDKINWWLLKYYELYKYCKENWNNCSCFGELPCSHTFNSEENKFIDFYQELDEISQLHKLNSECGEEILKLQEFKKERKLIDSWLRKNEELYNNLLIEFWLDTEIIDNYILLYFSNYKDLEIKIDQTEFKDVIEFLELFSEKENYKL